MTVGMTVVHASQEKQKNRIKTIGPTYPPETPEKNTKIQSAPGEHLRATSCCIITSSDRRVTSLYSPSFFFFEKVSHFCDEKDNTATNLGDEVTSSLARCRVNNRPVHE